VYLLPVLRQRILELLRDIVSYRVIALPTEYKERNKSRGAKNERNKQIKRDM
jgi:hypothetical protein